MRFNDIFGRMVNDGKRFKRDAWYDEKADALEMEPNYIFWQKGYPWPHGIEINSNTAEATGLPEGTRCYFLPYMMRHLGNNHFAPYQPTQDDLGATDWEPFNRKTLPPGVQPGDFGDVPTGMQLDED